MIVERYDAYQNLSLPDFQHQCMAASNDDLQQAWVNTAGKNRQLFLIVQAEMQTRELLRRENKAIIFY